MMTNSLLLGLVVCAFLIISQNVVLKIYKRFPEHGIGLMYGSLGVKLMFVCGITLVLYSNVKTILDLYVNNKQ